MRILIAILFFYVHSHAGIIDRAGLLPKRDIKVCFAHDENSFDDEGIKKLANKWGRQLPPSKEERQLIQAVVEKEYNRKTPIRFVGWNDCDKSKSDVIVGVFQSNGGSGKASFGLGSSYPDRRTPLKKLYSSGFVFLNAMTELYPENTSASFNFSWTALHEFGHVVGMRHDHSRKESKDDPNCEGTISWQFEEVHWPTSLIYPYDPQSISNYCAQNGIDKWGTPEVISYHEAHGPSLSEGDVQIIKEAYGNKK